MTDGSATSRPGFVFASTDAPSMGGASTALYSLFRRAQASGEDVHLINLLESRRRARLEATFGGALGNPDALPNVTNRWVGERLPDVDPGLADILDHVAPDLVVGFGFLSALLLKRTAPHRQVVFVTSTCRQAQDHVTTGRAVDAIDLAERLERRSETPRVINPGEAAAVDGADLVIAHTARTLELMQRFFPRAMGKIYPEAISFAEWVSTNLSAFGDLQMPFAERDIDVLFIASDWRRVEKNYPMVRALARALPRVRLHVVGHVERRLAGVTHHDFIGSRRHLAQLLGRTRCVVSPSLMDASPAVLLEGATMGCNMVATKNCGNFDVCNPDLLADRCEPGALAECIERAITTKHRDNLAQHVGKGRYHDFMGILRAAALSFAGMAPC